ncbi:MAG: PAS domain-containing protein [Paludibacteraceae bacterium]|nr:PAS domain-containing protein [Paludibacteraceae bacterium]
MKQDFLLSLIQNVAILLAFSMMYDYFWIRKKSGHSFMYKIGTGIFIAAVGYLLIRTPWTMIDGIIFDSRTILLSIAGLFFGAVPTIIAVLILSVYRFLIGGDGLYMGIATMITSGIIGILWHYLRSGWEKKNTIAELAVMGVIVHLIMLLCTFLLPDSIRSVTFNTIVFQVLFIYPVAGILLGLLMLRQHKNRQNEEDLATSEERWRFAIDGSGDGLWDWNILTNEVYFSPALTQMLGYKNAEMYGNIKGWEEKIHPEDIEKANRDVIDFVNGVTELLDSEYRMITKSGEYIWIQDRGMAMQRDEKGKAKRCIGTHRNITHRKEIEKALLESQQYTNSILTAIPDLIFVMNEKGVYLDFKSGKTVDLYLKPDDFINRYVTDILPDEVSGKIVSTITHVLKTNTESIIEYNLLINNKIEDYESHIIPFSHGKVVVMVRNITERKKSELQLLKSQSELKRFAAHLQNIREEERVNLAREIHDELGQILVAVKMELGMLMKKNNAQSCDKCIEMNENFIYLSSLVDQTITTARKIMTDLRPEVLDMFGVVDAIRQYTQKFEERYKVRAIFSTESDQLELSREQSVALFRIVQEALTNVAKHAKATEVHVMLGMLENGYYLEITDNGKGFDACAPKRNDSYGMLGMKERAYLINADLQIESESGKGVTIRLECVND